MTVGLYVFGYDSQLSRNRPPIQVLPNPSSYLRSDADNPRRSCLRCSGNVLARFDLRACCTCCVAIPDRHSRLVANCSRPPPKRSRWQRRSCGLTAASGLLLNWRTLHRAERAEHATVARLWAQQRPAIPEFIEVLATVRGHSLLRCEAAAWAPSTRIRAPRCS